MDSRLNFISDSKLEIKEWSGLSDRNLYLFRGQIIIRDHNLLNSERMISDISIGCL